ncbi:hypothetical protein HQ587_05065 [bacterium]|nr:hypothetical protein [bacterium]
MKADDLFGGELSVTLTYRSTYNSNLLNYSVRDRNRFLDDIESHTSPIRSLDDVRSDFKISASYVAKFLSDRKTKLTATGNFAHHIMDPIKNFGWTSLTMSQELTKSLYSSLNYFYDINYYIRDYKDVHTDQKHPCGFDMDQWTAKLGYRPVKPLEFVGIGRFKKYAYNKYFTEYDSDYIEGGGEVIYRNYPWRLAAGYSLADNDNVGYVGLDTQISGVDLEDSEEGNGDYQQDAYWITVRYAFRMMGKRARVLLETELRDRYYTTDRDIDRDPIHRSRRDVVLVLDVSGRININNYMTITVGSKYGNRRSNSLKPIVARVKDYDRTMGYIEFSYELF